MLRFRQDTREAVEDLVRREAACCPFVDYRVEVAGDEVVWTTSNPRDGDERTDIDVIREALYELPDHVGAGLEGYFERLADRGIDVVQAGSARLEVRR